MALNDIVFPAGVIGALIDMNRGDIGTISDIVTEIDMLMMRHVPGWPVVADVKLGVDYGPTGVEYEGTYAPAGGAVYPVIGGAHIITKEGDE